MYIAGNSTDALYRVDADDFTVARVDASLSAFGVGETEPSGTAWHNGVLYMVGGATDALYTMDPDTGRATLVDQDTVQFGVSENSPRDITSHNGELYMLGGTTDALYKLNTLTGEAERIGHANQFGQNRNDPAALASFGSPAQLYALFGDTSTLYRLDTDTGTATSVSAAVPPDGSSPQAMAVHNDRLYAVGANPTRVWEVRISGNTATTVNMPISAGFNVSENLPGGIAASYVQPSGYSIDQSTGAITYTGGPAPHGIHTLYAQVRDSKTGDGADNTTWDDTAAVTVNIANQTPLFNADSYTYTLPSGSDGTTTPITVGTPQATDPEGDTLAYSLRASDPVKRMYMTGLNAKALYTLDSTTGQASRVSAATAFGVAETWPISMAWHNGQLYMTGNTNNSLYILDTDTGQAAPVATAAQITGDPDTAAQLNGLASHEGELYLSTITPGRIYRLDPDTLTGTQIGDDDFGATSETKPLDISWHSTSGNPGSPAVLYMVGDDTDKLHTIDTVTGQATPVGTAIAFGAGETKPAALASHNGKLYMTGNTNKQLYTLNTATGQTTTGKATPVGTVERFGVDETYVQGLATGYAEPVGFAVDTATGTITYTGSSAPAGIHTLYVRTTDGKAADNTTGTDTDDTATVTVVVPNRTPTFAQNPYNLSILPGADGSTTDQPVGEITATDPENDSLTYSLRTSDPPRRMYMTGSTADALYTLDSTTGTATRIGATVAFGVSETIPGALTWHNGQLYMTGFGTNSLYTLDTDTGETVLVVTGTQITGSHPTTRRLSGIASHNGHLYLTTTTTGGLYRVDLDTLTGTQISDDDFGDVNETYPYDIVSHRNPNNPDSTAELYMIGADTDKLYTLDTTTGGATSIGAAIAFDVGETRPAALTSHNGKLYMTGNTNSRLYILNTTTGVATPVGNTTHFGTYETSPHGIATGYTKPPDFAINTTTGAITYTGPPATAGNQYTLYGRVSDNKTSNNTPDDTDTDNTITDDTTIVMIKVTNRTPSFNSDSYSYTLVPESDGITNPITATTPVMVGTPQATDPESQTLIYTLRASDPAGRMYMTSATTDALYTLDSATSEATRVGTAEKFGVGETIPSGMAWHDGQLYMAGYYNNNIYTLDTETGEAALIATAAQITGSGGPDRQFVGVASHDGHLYVTTAVTGRLYRVDLDTLTGTQIGEDDFGDIGETHPYGIASHGSPAELYMVGTNTDKLYKLDTDTGEADIVGTATGFGAVGETSPSALASHGGSLYMTGNENNQLYRLDTDTGEATRVGDATDFSTKASDVFGIATGYALPSGFTINATTGEIAYAAASGTPGVHTLYARVSDGKAADNTASTTVDDTARVTVTVPNRAPSFTQDSYDLSILPGTDGSSAAALIDDISATDPDGDTLTYSLRSPDPDARMYMTGNTADALYTLDSNTGEAARVGDVTQFGVHETIPGGMAWHNGQLYMIGFYTNNLYTLDTDTGEATLAATSLQITGDSGPAARRLGGVASHDGDLYVSTVIPGGLYRVSLDTLTDTPADTPTDTSASTSASTQIGVDNFGAINETLPYGIASHGSPAELYMIGDDTDRLHIIDTTTGEVTPIGDATDFNVGETLPSGLASHGGGLYMIGNSGNRLYRIDTATGEAVPVGDATDFNVGESLGHGIASRYAPPEDLALGVSTGAVTYTGGPAVKGTGYTLYARVSDGRADDDTASSAIDDTATVRVTVTNRDPSFSADSYSYTLTSGSDGSTTPITVGAPAAVDPERQALTYSLRTSDPAERMYMVGTATNALYSLDSITGTAVRIGEAERFGVDEQWPLAMTWHNGQLYMIGSDSYTLYTLDIVTGEADPVATGAQITGSDEPRVLSGLASHEGGLYVTSIIKGRLYRFDLDTLRGIQIGVDNFGVGADLWPLDIASHGNPAKLYMVEYTTSKLYTIDVKTGVLMPVGQADDFGGVDELTPVGLVSHNDGLYMTGHTNNWLYRLDTDTGEAERMGDATDFGVGETEASGIATGYDLPSGFTIDAATGRIAYTSTAAATGAHTLYVQVSDGKTADNTDSEAVDDITRVTVTVPNQAPAFTRDSYNLNILPGTDGSGTAVPGGKVTATDPEGDAITYGLRASDPVNRMYMVGQTANALYTLNRTDGTAARVGEADGFGVGIIAVHAIAWHKGKLYLVGATADAIDGIFTLDTATGVATPVARLRDMGVDTAPLTGITSHDGYLYITASGTGRLFKADLRARTAVQIGSDDFGTVGETAPVGAASHNGKLYMIGGDTDRLYEIDTDTGDAAAVGTATRFDAPDGGEGDPSGLASHGSVLYMLGNDNDRLYTLNTTTGTATRVGSAIGFNASEDAPAGIASGYSKPASFAIAPSTGTITYTGSAATAGAEYTLYALISDARHPEADIAVSTADDTATVTIRVENAPPAFAARSYQFVLAPDADGRVKSVPVGTTTASDPDTADSITYSLRASDPGDRMYMAGGTTDALYTLSSTTGVAARTGTVADFGVNEAIPRGMAWHNGRLYMVGSATNSLYTLDIVTGEAAPVATGAQITGSTGPLRRLSGVASHNGGLYVTTTITGRLYHIDTDTWSGTQIGGDDFGDASETHPYDIASHGSPAVLYMIGDKNDKLYTLDIATGEATPVGDKTDFGTVSETSPAALTSHGGGLYMTGDEHNRLYRLNTDTGAATPVATETDFDAGESFPHGIATGYALSEEFIVNTATGTISYTGSPAVEGTEYTVYVQASDGKAANNTTNTAVDDTAAVTVTVTVTANTDSPPIHHDDTDQVQSLLPIQTDTPPPPPPSQANTPPPPPTTTTPSQTDTPPPPQTGTQQPQLQDYFTDDGSPASPNVHESNINYIAAAGITQGCNPQGTLFCPNKPVTRAQMASFLARALQLTPPTDADSAAGTDADADTGAFLDIAGNPQGAFLDITDNPHYDNIRAITAAGITLGCDSAGRYFCPDRPTTRAQMASFLTRAFDLPIPPHPASHTFLDIAGNPHQDSIRAIAAAGITRGCYSAIPHFCPDRPTTRSEMATFLARALQR